ncbi:hypothetical protein OMP38_19270 [Cohnella ginsengisoli]|uniref:YqzN/YkzM domain-containing protein n=1 Tax=Cohnella ginsengisoli TaxID=425004 RepID=A0A9X4KIU1_9BACL|nr:hypothetical protein [Cohnella ginsengisoli]MDG0792775.1 hypothetical protein [Cohnella ginsengisoli]
MAGKKQGDDTVATYGKDELIAYAGELFGVSPEAVQGALHGSDAGERFTIESARALVDNFMNRKVN